MSVFFQGLGAGSLLVNPFDLEDMSQAMVQGLNMSATEREERCALFLLECESMSLLHRHEYLYNFVSKYTVSAV